MRKPARIAWMAAFALGTFVVASLPANAGSC
jgi:hypothetical protein